MAAAAAEMMLGRLLFDGSLSLHQFEIERRPYHRNCGCALHNLKGVCVNACSQKRNVSFPKKQKCAHHSLSMAVSSKISSQSSRNKFQLQLITNWEVRNPDQAYNIDD